MSEAERKGQPQVNEVEQSANAHQKPPEKLIIDTDLGFDDARALVYT